MLFNGHVIITRQVNVRRGIRIVRITQDPRRVLALLMQLRFRQRPSITVGRALCLDQGYFVIFFLRRLRLAIRFNANGRIGGRLAIFQGVIYGLLLIEYLGNRGRLQEQVNVAHVLRFKLHVSILGVCSGSIARRARQAIGGIEPRAQGARETFDLERSQRVHVRRVGRYAVQARPTFIVNRRRRFVQAST